MAKRGRKKKRNIGKEVAVVVLIIISVLLAILIYTKSGVIGKTISPLLGGMMGWIKYILPAGTFLIAIYIAYEDKEYAYKKLLPYVVILLCISIIMTTYQLSKNNIDINSEFSEMIRQSYKLGEQDIGGGVIGALAAIPLIKLIGMLGTVIVSIGLASILLIYLFGIKPSELIHNWIENRKAGREERKNEKAEQKRIREEAIKEAKETKQKEKAIENQITISMGKKSAAEPNALNLQTHAVEEEIAPQPDNPDQLNNLFKQQQEEKQEKTREVLVLEHTLTVEDEHYEFPPIQLLSQNKNKGLKTGKRQVADTATKLQKTLYSFGVSAKVENVSVGPSITRYELRPAEGVRVNKIANLADDIALNLAAESIRIEAPIPGKQLVGIEIPNKENEIVNLRDIIETEKFQNDASKLTIALGKDVAGEEIITDIAKMPHVLVAGATGSGKSVCINTLITSIIYKAKPSEVKLLMIDPKVVELSSYNGIPHLLIPVVTDPKKAAGALSWAVQEMVNRYGLFAAKGVRDIKGYNEELEKEEGIEKLPQIVIIIDELADLMMVAQKDVEDAICRLAQMARACRNAFSDCNTKTFCRRYYRNYKSKYSF